MTFALLVLLLQSSTPTLPAAELSTVELTPVEQSQPKKTTAASLPSRTNQTTKSPRRRLIPASARSMDYVSI
jgi:hypothetical protein